MSAFLGELLRVSQLNKNVKVCNDQKMAQLERNSHSKIRSGKKLNKNSGTYTKKTYSKPNGLLFSQ